MLTQILPLMGLNYLTDMEILALRTIDNQAGVEDSTALTPLSVLWKCAAFVAVGAIGMETNMKIKE